MERTIEENDSNLIFNTKEFKFKHYQGDWKSAYNIAQFKPSTKEAFDAQNKPKFIEKWSPGNLCCLYKGIWYLSFKVGDVAQIQDGAYKINEDCVDISKSVKKSMYAF